MTPKQKQAAIVCAVCALALVLTASITGVLVSRKIKGADGKSESQIAAENGYDASAYVLSGSAVLAQTDAAESDYLQNTLFIGDSNTVRMYNNGLITVQQFCAQEGLGIQDAATKKIVQFKGDDTLYTIPDAVAKMKPRRVLITLGTNNGDGSMSTDDFIADYKTLIAAIQTSYSYTDIIVDAIPPVPAKHSTYPNMDQKAIDAYNMALATLCEQMNCKFLNSAEALKDDSGYGKSVYFAENDIHFTKSGLSALLDYYTTHVYSTEDRRPDTNNIPTRIESYTSNTAGTASSGTATPTASAKAVNYKASYYVQSEGGGTLSSGSDTGKSSLQYDVKDAETSITVKAVPNTGYVFVKWSDGSTSAERTDTNFTKNVNVTAVFSQAGISVSASAETAETGKSVTVTASLTGGAGTSDNIKWYVNDSEAGSGGTYTFNQTATGSYKVYAKLSVGGTEVQSNTVTITVTPAATPVPTAAPTATPEAAPEATAAPPATPEVTAAASATAASAPAA